MMFAKNRYVLLAFFFMNCVVVFSQSIKKFNVYFDSNKSELSPKSKHTIDSVFKLLKNMPQAYKVTITGHTDNTGGKELNKNLSLKRAKEITRYFENKEFLKSKIHYLGVGDEDPLVSNVDEIGKSRNRRVEIEMLLDIPKINAIGELKIKEDVYKIKAEEGDFVTYKSGTQITIPPNSFVDNNGKIVKGDIVVNYIEYREPIDFILGGIPMSYMTKDNLYHFNSAGMFKITATSNGQPISIKPGATINVDFVLTEKLDNLNLYRFDTLAHRWMESAVLGQNSTRSFGSMCGGVLSGGKRICEMNECEALIYLVQTGTEYAVGEKKMANRKDSLKILNPIIESAAITAINFTEKQKKLNILKDSVSKLINKEQHLYKLVIAEKNKKKIKFNIKCMSGKNANEFDGYKQMVFEYKFQKGKALKDSILKKQFESCELVSLDGKFLYEIKLGNNINVGPVKIIPGDKIGKKELGLFEATYRPLYEEYKSRITPLYTYKSDLVSGLKATKQTLDSVVTFAEKNWKEDSLNMSVLKSQNEYLFCFRNLSAASMTPIEKLMKENEWYSFFDNNKPLMFQRYDNIRKANEQYKECLNKAEKSEKLKDFVQQKNGKTDTLAQAAKNRFNEIVQQKKSALENLNKTLANTVRQQLSISNLGIWNCDQIMQLAEPVFVFADYKDENNKIIKPIVIYLIDSKLNGMLQYSGDYNLSPYKFAFNLSSKNTLIAFDANLKPYIFTADKFEKIDAKLGQQLKYTFVLKSLNNIKTKEDMRALINKK